MGILFVLFVIAIGWLFLTYYVLYAYTGVWYYLLILCGAALSLSYLFLRDRWEFAGLLILIGSLLLCTGIAWILTFGASREVERLQASSWKGIFFGSIPERFRKGLVDRRNGVLLSSLSLFFALVMFKGGNTAMALNFTVVGIVAGIYSIWVTIRGRAKDK